MNYEQALDYIHSFERFGWDLTLDRLRVLLDELGNPQERLRCIHVAGSDGKGSVCNMTAQVLTRAGYRTGLYTSPFVVDFRERFQIDGEMIGKEDFSSYAARLKVAIRTVNARGIHITEFEAITALGFLWFAEQRCDYLVLEVGLGGRFDATNVIQNPFLCAVVSISLDHIDFLGDTIQKIAFEKAGILKQGCTCCCYPRQHPDAVAILMERCAETSSRLVQANPNAVTILSCDETGSQFTYHEQRYSVALVGRHQVDNALLVLSMMEELQKKGLLLPTETIIQGIAETQFPARFERISESPYVVVDIAHNAEEVQALCQTLQGIQRRKIVVMGMLADKDYLHAVAQIAGQATVFFAVPTDSPRALPPEGIAAAAEEHCADVRCCSDCTVAAREALALVQEGDMLIGCGSFYMVSGLRGTLLNLLNIE